MDRPVWILALVVAAALGVRLGYVAITPEHALVHDAREYDEHARSVAVGEGFSERITGKPTAFRPPGYVYLLAGAYRLAGVERSPVEARILVGRRMGAILGALGVALIGVLAWQLWGSAAGIVATALAAVYVPSIFVATALMSEQLFVVLMLATLIAVLAWRRTPRWWLVLLAGGLAGLAVLTRANGLILLLPLALAIWRRSPWPPVLLVAVALLTIAPWTLRNASTLGAFVPVTTQLGSALAGTYNGEARADPKNPGSWRSLRRVEEYDHLTDDFATTPEAVMEGDLRRAALTFIGEHPAYLLSVAYWNTRRLLDLASWRWSIHTASTISVTAGWAAIGVICFWVFAALALLGVRRAPAPAFVWLVPLAMYVSVVFLAAETPRYRAPLDPFVIALAALALVARARREPSPGARGGRRRLGKLPPHDHEDPAGEATRRVV